MHSFYSISAILFSSEMSLITQLQNFQAYTKTEKRNLPKYNITYEN